MTCSGPPVCARPAEDDVAGSPRRHSGTSYVAPIVAGQVALLLTTGSARRQADAQDRITRSVDNIDALNGIRLGFGQINLSAALPR